MTTLTRAALANVEDRLKGELGWDAVELRVDYSGRGMFGRRCVAFTCDNVADLRLALAVVEHDDDPDLAAVAAELHDRPAQDSMGMSSIAYWPWLQAAA